MIKTLPKARIIEIVQECAGLAPDADIQATARRIVLDIQNADFEVTTTDDATLFVRNVVTYFHELIQPDYLERLNRTDIYVVPQPLCNARADHATHSIVLFDGLFKVLMFRMEFSLLLAEVNKHLEAVGDKIGLSRKELPHIAYRAQSLSLHFLHHPEPLPELNEHFDERLKQDARVAFCGGLLFILFHELGHLELGHAGTLGTPRLKSTPTLACVEDLNSRKTQEFEADAYAFEAFVPKARSMVIVNVWYVMSLFLDYESLAGPGNVTHPFSINRVSHLNQISGALEDPSIAASAIKLFEARLNLMRTRLDAVHPEEHLLPAATRSQLNREAYMSVLDDTGNCRAALAKLVDAYRAIIAT